MRVTRLLVRYKDGYLWHPEEPSEGSIEGFVRYSEDTEGEARRKAQVTLDELSVPRWSYTIRVEPQGGDVPGVDFDVGDTITIPDHDGTPGLVRVLGWSQTETDEGDPVYEVEVGSHIPSPTERNAQVTRSMSPGTLGGRDRQATSASGLAGQSASKVTAVPSGGGTVEAFRFRSVTHLVGDGVTEEIPFLVTTSEGYYTPGITVTTGPISGTSRPVVPAGLWVIGRTIFVSEGNGGVPTTGDIAINGFDVREDVTSGHLADLFSPGQLAHVCNLTEQRFLDPAEFASWPIQTHFTNDLDVNVQVGGYVYGFGVPFTTPMETT